MGAPSSKPSMTPRRGSVLGTDVGEGLYALREVGFQVGAAAMQVARGGSDAQVAKTKAILEDARRKIYGILAEDDQTPEG